MAERKLAETKGFDEARSRIAEALRTGATALNLSDLGLTELPLEIGGLTALTELNVSYNQFSALPPKIGRFTALTVLNVSGNRLSALPAEIGRLTALTALGLARNQLSALPPEIGQLTALTVLYVQNNQLSALPAELCDCKTLERLFLHGNDALGLPPEVLGPGWLEVGLGKSPAAPADILDYYFRTRREATRVLNEAKVLLVGEAAVGKTSLVRALVHNQACRPAEKITEGIRIDRWTVAGKREAERIRLNVWDFGGQEIMHATHQFFLTKRSLYLVVLDARQDEKQGRLEYWLRLVQSFGGESPVIVVINKVDDGRLQLDRTGLADKYKPNLLGFVETSCSAGLRGIAELRETIGREIRKLEHVDSRLPATWFDVKAALEDEAKHTPHMPYAGYQEICHKHGVQDEGDQERLVRFLHDLGVILNFRDDDHLQALGVLSPNWVTAGVHGIIRSERVNRSAGVLPRDCLGEVLNAGQYPSDKRSFILDMMQRFELCFEFDDGTHRRWLIPGLLAKDRPAFEWDERDLVRFEYRYAVLPGSVIWRFIVRNHPLLGKTPVYWRSGVLLHIDGAEALVVADEEDRRVSIAVRGPSAGQRRAAVTHVRMELEHIHGNLPRIEAKGRVPLPDRPELGVDYFHLLRLEAAGTREYWPEGAEHEYSVRELLEGVAETATRESDLAQLLRASGASVRIDRMEIGHLGTLAMPGQKDDHSMSVGGDAIGSTLNTGTISGQVRNTINSIPAKPGGKDGQQIKDLLSALHTLVEEGRKRDVNEQTAADAMSDAGALAEAAKEPKKPGMLERAGKALRSLGRVAKDFGTIVVEGRKFAEVVHSIEQWFGLPGAG
jgi:internalin A